MKLNNRAPRPAVVVLAAFAFVLTGAAPSVRGESLESRVIAMFPKDVGEIAYADLSQVRNFPWYAQFKQQALPPRFIDFAQFLKSAGIDPETEIDGVAWALTSNATRKAEKEKTESPIEQVVCIATGRYNPDTTQDFFAAHNIQAVKYLDYKLYPASAAGGADVFMMFVDSSTIAFGPRSLLERLIGVQGGAEENLAENETVVSLINQVNGSGIFWGVLNNSIARQAIQLLVPVVGQFAQAGGIIDKIGAVTIRVQGSDRMEANIVAVVGSAGDAAILSQLLQAGLMVRQYQATQSNADLAQALGGASIASSGKELSISFTVSEEQLIALVKQNSFAMKM